MSSDSIILPKRALVVVACLVLAGFISGCQVRPLYQESAGGISTGGNLNTISFSEAGDRVSQEVRNNLIFLTSGGAGEAKNPVYHLDVAITESVGTPLLDDTSTMPKMARLNLRAVYKLSRVSDGLILRAATRQAVSLYDYPQQEFAKLRAKRDAQNRAAKELAEIIRGDLAAYLSRPEKIGVMPQPVK